MLEPALVDMPRHATWTIDEQVLRETAYHEAGHAVLAKLTGTHIAGAIDARVASKQGAFDCEYLEALHQARAIVLGVAVDPIKESAVISAGGAVAQARFMFANGIGLDSNGKWIPSTDNYVSLCALHDRNEVRRTLGIGHWEEVTRTASNVLSRPGVWSAVEILAAEVIRRNGMVPKNTVDNLLHQAFIELHLPECSPLI